MSDGVAPSKGAWTPGPWKIHGEWPDDVVDADGSLVVSAYGDYDSPKTQANAKLIAKSPQMAELIRCIVEWEADYRRINNLSGHPEWVGRAERLLSELEVKP